MPRDSTTMCSDFACLVPSGVSSSLVNVMVFIVAYPTIFTRFVIVTLSRTNLFKIFRNTSLCPSDDNSNDNIEI